MEGSQFRAARNDAANHAVQIVKHVSRSDAHNIEAFIANEPITMHIPKCLVLEGMCLPIDLNNQTFFQTSEVGRHPPDRKLPPKFEAVGTAAKGLPQ